MQRGSEIEFRVNEVTRETARFWSNKILATGLQRVPNYTGLHQPDRFYIGYIGEITFRNVLWYYGKRFRFAARLDGHPDEADVIAWILDEPCSLNIKTSDQQHHRHLMIPVAQFVKRRQDYYICANLREYHDMVTFKGWLTHDEVSRQEQVQLKVMTIRAAFADLHSMRDLIDRLDNIKSAPV